MNFKRGVYFNMKNDKSKNVIIALLVVIIIILGGLVVLFATDTISFSSSEIDINGSNQNIVENVEQNNYDAELIAKEKMPVAISFINQKRMSSVYCGAFEDDDSIIMDTDDESVKFIMYASKKFDTFEQLKDHLKKNLSEELINKYLNSGQNSYLERWQTLLSNIT